ncbi:hypothetical protein M5K25_027779 [Dendrobium thyrsiflorum]|uniref:Uncharacterized protein n=1 Tax=Dendrobium thyrsiflorum TaxID=117978 RepID=A0ABD0TUV8_DENTH
MALTHQLDLEMTRDPLKQSQSEGLLLQTFKQIQLKAKATFNAAPHYMAMLNDTLKEKLCSAALTKYQAYSSSKGLGFGSLELKNGYLKLKIYHLALKRMVGEWMMDLIKIPWFRRPGPSWSLVYLVRGGSRPNLTEGSLSAAMGCFVQWYLVGLGGPRVITIYPAVPFGDKTADSILSMQRGVCRLAANDENEKSEFRGVIPARGLMAALRQENRCKREAFLF